jgi:hypothetical protein
MKTLIFTFAVLTLFVNISFAQLNTENFLKVLFISAFIENELFTNFWQINDIFMTFTILTDLKFV